MKSLLLSILLTIICVPVLAGSTIDVGIGPSFTYHTIQDGIDAAINGDTVLVHDGTYIGSGNKNINCLGKQITVRSLNGSPVTTIDLEDSGRAFEFTSGEDRSTHVSGFTITRGLISGPSARGGAIYISNSSPILVDLTITECVATNGSGGPLYSSYGGGICLENSSAALVNIIVSNNVATNGAGGTGATAYGGGIYIAGGSPELHNLLIVENLATDGVGGQAKTANGGGIYMENTTSALLNNLTLAYNQVEIVAADIFSDPDWFSDHSSFGPSFISRNSSNLLSRNIILVGIAESWMGTGHLSIGGQDNTSAYYVVVGDFVIGGYDTGSGGFIVNVTFGGFGTPSFASGPLGDYYDYNGPNRDGSDLSSVFGLDVMTTRVDGAPDLGIVDLGYHYYIPEPAPQFLGGLGVLASSTYAGNYGGGSGTMEDPYRIWTAEQMNAIGLNEEDWDKYFKLTANLDLTGLTMTPIGNIATPFSGTFDGNRHTIANLTINLPTTDYVGLFGCVDNALDPMTIFDLGLIDPVISGDYAVGALAGAMINGVLSGCYVEGGSVSGGHWSYNLGGLCGYNAGDITNCYATGSVSGGYGAYNLGGLCGYNAGDITNSYATGIVTGTGRHIGGLVGRNNSGTISKCYATGMVTGVDYGIVGGLVGHNDSGTITNCYATGSVTGKWYFVGGLCGWNDSGTITNSYATGTVTGGNYSCSVGGLVGRKDSGTITNCFWDVETSGIGTSGDGNYGAIGKTTDEMQTLSTFIDAGWDFVGETANGTEDIWFIRQGDYPRLWWEGMQVPMKITPRTLNCRSKGNWVQAHFTLPEGYTIADIDSNRPAVVHSYGIESAPVKVFVNEEECVEVSAAFEREAVCSLTGDWPEVLNVAGFLTNGDVFLGTSTVRIITPGLQEIVELASQWLQEDCVSPDWCDGTDLSRDSVVNFLDYPLMLNSQVEFIPE